MEMFSFDTLTTFQSLSLNQYQKICTSTGGKSMCSSVYDTEPVDRVVLFTNKRVPRLSHLSSRQSAVNSSVIQCFLPLLFFAKVDRISTSLK